MPECYDLIVVGTGVAGLTAAIEAGNSSVLIITKTKAINSGSSPLAQGGIAASVGKDDSPDIHYDDTIKAGVYSGRPDQVSFLTEHGSLAINRLMDFDMEFDKTDDGELDRNREGAHSRRRVLKAGGDATGKVLVETLYNVAKSRKNIHWLSETFVQDLLIKEFQIHGVSVYNQEKGWFKVLSPRVILATGGIGQVFGQTTNPLEATGDSMAMAIRSGLKLKELEMVQFHPTALNIRRKGSLKLLTEALRGDGAKLVDENRTAFMGKYSKDKELAPRDVVARAIWSEMQKGHKIFLDLGNIVDITGKFPTVSNFCFKAGLNPARDLIPVTPAVHYVMGGVDINTSLPEGFGVAGEAAYTGVHGANRLASNSLLECLVYGRSEVLRILKENHEVENIEYLYPDVKHLPDMENIQTFREELQGIMFRHCGIIRNREGLTTGLKDIKRLKKRFSHLPKQQDKFSYEHVTRWLELNNMIIVSESLIESAIYREESRGAHYREDFPNKSIRWDRIKIKE